MASNAVVAGPASAQLAKNVERVRKARQLHQKDLSARLREVGRPMLPTVVSKIERGERRVDADDLVALALALNVSPLTLLLPPDAGDDPVDLTGSYQVTSRTAWQWGAGLRTAMDWRPGDGVNMTAPGVDPAIAQEAYEREQEFGRRQADYQALARPREVHRGASHPVVRLIRQLEEIVADIVEPEPGVDRSVLAARARMARRRVQKLSLDLEEISEELPVVHPGLSSAEERLELGPHPENEPLEEKIAREARRMRQQNEAIRRQEEEDRRGE